MQSPGNGDTKDFSPLSELPQTSRWDGGSQKGKGRNKEQCRELEFSSELGLQRQLLVLSLSLPVGREPGGSEADLECFQVVSEPSFPLNQCFLFPLPSDLATPSAPAEEELCGLS